ncbi:MAG: DUF2079 domain-containing protein [Dehalococcoidia bacterium]
MRVAVHDATVRAPAEPRTDSTPARGDVRTWHLSLLLGMVALAWVVFAWALVAQHRAHNSNAFDLGFFDQIIWNTSQGRWFQTSFVDYNFLGQHMQPVLLLFAGLYRIRPAVEILLLVQAAVVAGAAVPLYIAARRLLATASAALLVAGAYLIAPHLHGAVLFDFHPELMGAAGIFGSLALLAVGRPSWAMAAFVTVFLLKEDAALAGAGFSVVVWILGYRRTAVALCAASLLYLTLTAGVIMPALRDRPGDLQERYGYLGADNRTAVTTVLRHPDRVAEHLGGRPQRQALSYLLATTALLPLVTPAALAAAPLLAANLLSTHPAQHDLTLHYPALSHALVFVAALLGIRGLARSRRATGRLSRLPAGTVTTALAGLLFATSAITWAFGSPLGLRMFDADRYRQTAHDQAVERVIAAVPPDAAVSAQSGLLPHLSQRRDIWEFPRLERAEYVIIDRTAWRTSQSDAAGFERTFHSLPAFGYCPVLTDDGVTLYRRSRSCASPL